MVWYHFSLSTDLKSHTVVYRRRQNSIKYTETKVTTVTAATKSPRQKSQLSLLPPNHQDKSHNCHCCHQITKTKVTTVTAATKSPRQKSQLSLLPPNHQDKSHNCHCCHQITKTKVTTVTVTTPAANVIAITNQVHQTIQRRGSAFWLLLDDLNSSNCK